MAALQVSRQMSEHGLPVHGYDHPMFSFSPQQEVRILSAQRQIGRIADPGNIDDIQPGRVVLLQGTPKRAAQVFVENKAQRHPLKAPVRDDGLDAPPERIHVHSFLSRPAFEFFDIEVSAGGALLIDFRLTPGDVGIHLYPVFRVELKHLIDEFQRQTRELLVQHLGGKAIVVIQDHMVQPDPVSCQDDLAVGPFGQELG
jgi:hypothetical protein